MKTKTIDNSEDILDSRDVLERFNELDEIEQRDGDEQAEWQALKDFIDDGNDEWEHGETLIRDSYFETYAQELAEDLGEIPQENRWPRYCIDWAWAARELQMDYTSAEFDGVTYWYHS